MLILCSVMYFDLKHMLVALVQNVLPVLMLPKLKV